MLGISLLLHKEGDYLMIKGCRDFMISYEFDWKFPCDKEGLAHQFSWHHVYNCTMEVVHTCAMEVFKVALC